MEGKKGFEKVRGACAERGCLGRGLSWLGVDVESLGGEEVWEDGGGKGLHARVFGCKAEPRIMERVLVPDVLGAKIEDMDEEEWWEIVEWVDLVALRSSRVEQGDVVDPYVSRYTVPESSKKEDLEVMRWEGLMSSEWITRLIIEVVKESRICKSNQWVALSVVGHEIEAVGGVDGYTILFQAGETAAPDQIKHDSEQLQERQDAMKMDRAETRDQPHKGTGLQTAVCFQFVDSVIS